jgi:hypothetical protein
MENKSFDLKKMKRIRDLHVGDIFIYFEKEIYIREVKEGFFYCKSLYNTPKRYNKISCKSQQKVEYVGSVEPIK